jgi:hypothetical protein
MHSLHRPAGTNGQIGLMTVGDDPIDRAGLAALIAAYPDFQHPCNEPAGPIQGIGLVQCR